MEIGKWFETSVLNDPNLESEDLMNLAADLQYPSMRYLTGSTGEKEKCSKGCHDPPTEAPSAKTILQHSIGFLTHQLFTH